MAHLIFLTSTPPSIAEGSGTWVGISVLRDAILAMGHQVTLMAPSPSAGRTTVSRILFNLRARSRLRHMNADVLIGFDLDRSEEHTSELQSRPHLVCRLL